MNNKFMLGCLAGLSAAIIWGLWPVLTRSGVTSSFSPNEIVVLRFIVCGLLLFPIFLKNKCFQKVSVIKSIVLTSGAGALYVYASALGLKFAPAGHLGVVGTGSMLLLSALGGFLVLKETKNRWQILGYIVVISGMILINIQNLFVSYSKDVLFGDLFLAIGGGLWAMYTVFNKKWLISSWDAVSIVSVYSFVIFVPIIFIMDYENINLLSKPLDDLLVQAIGQGIIAAIVALYLFTLSVNLLGASKGSSFGAFVPGTAMLGGFIYLNEVPTYLEVFGVLFATIGIVLILSERKKILK